MPFGTFPKGLPSVSKVTGVHKINSDPNGMTPASAPKRITSIEHLGNMLSGLKNRMSQKYSRLGPPKQPHVRKGKVS